MQVTAFNTRGPVRFLRLGIRFGALFFFIILFGGLFLLINGIFSSTDIYKMTMQQAQASPCITSKLGRPLHLRGIISGSVSTATDNGKANLTIPVHGPLAGGSLVVAGAKESGIWHITSLILRSHDRDFGVNLADPSSCLNWD